MIIIRWSRRANLGSRRTLTIADGYSTIDKKDYNLEFQFDSIRTKLMRMRKQKMWIERSKRTINDANFNKKRAKWAQKKGSRFKQKFYRIRCHLCRRSNKFRRESVKTINAMTDERSDSIGCAARMPKMAIGKQFIRRWWGFYAMQLSLGCLHSVEDGSRFPFGCRVCTRDGENEKIVCWMEATKWSEIWTVTTSFHLFASRARAPMQTNQNESNTCASELMLSVRHRRRRRRHRLNMKWNNCC